MNAKKINPKITSVVSIRMVKEAEVEYEKPISSPGAAAKLLYPFFKDLDREHFYVVCLSTQKEVTAINLVAVGRLNAANIEMKDVLKPAILSNADSILVAHNHPSGHPSFSKNDKVFTRRLREAAQLFHIDLVDHILFYGPKEHDVVSYCL